MSVGAGRADRSERCRTGGEAYEAVKGMLADRRESVWYIESICSLAKGPYSRMEACLRFSKGGV